MEVTIPLTKGRFALIDSSDLGRVAKYRWYFGSMGNGYAICRVSRPDGKFKNVLLHRFILDAPYGLEVDHINGDSLDNTRKNLRLCTHKQNIRNQRVQTRVGKASRFKGVWMSKSKRWRAEICVDGKRLYLGTFDNEEDAARAYDEKAKRHFGEFASPNFKECHLTQ